LEVKRLDLDACKTKVKKSQSPEKMRQVGLYTLLNNYTKDLIMLFLEIFIFITDNNISNRKFSPSAIAINLKFCSNY